MQNVVSLKADRPRPQRALAAPRGGARILLFTGVRYCREEAMDEGAPPLVPALHRPVSDRLLDAAAH